MGMPRLAEFASDAAIDDISASGSARFSRNLAMAKKIAAVASAATAVTSSGSAKTSCSLRLAEGLEQQRGAGHKECQAAEDLAGVLAQDLPPAHKPAHQDDAPDNKKARKHA